MAVPELLDRNSNLNWLVNGLGREMSLSVVAAVGALTMSVQGYHPIAITCRDSVGAWSLTLDNPIGCSRQELMRGIYEAGGAALQKRVESLAEAGLGHQRLSPISRAWIAYSVRQIPEEERTGPDLITIDMTWRPSVKDAGWRAGIGLVVGELDMDNRRASVLLLAPTTDQQFVAIPYEVPGQEDPWAKGDPILLQFCVGYYSAYLALADQAAPARRLTVN